MGAKIQDADLFIKSICQDCRPCGSVYGIERYFINLNYLVCHDINLIKLQYFISTNLISV
jgi:hypothetical protein